ncbi:hypothetical protein AVEN_118755-1 [Araneus ventricosus]|uniref:Uncharacterized protein n=1 Tax=Araneus ventricosus TaxID=182803 RepID=A0A4Y2BVI3_ARAVE|nr:hypothetical protein AVEN_118755-1 [Araneus ventricosus]
MTAYHERKLSGSAAVERGKLCKCNECPTWTVRRDRNLKRPLDLWTMEGKKPCDHARKQFIRSFSLLQMFQSIAFSFFFIRHDDGPVSRAAITFARLYESEWTAVTTASEKDE